MHYTEIEMVERMSSPMKISARNYGELHCDLVDASLVFF